MGFSISVTVDTSQLEEIIRRCGYYPPEVGKEIGGKILAESQVLCPVDTSALVNSGKVTYPGGNILAKIEYGPAITANGKGDYGIFQELGFHHWRSGEFIQNPFLVPAVEHWAGMFLAPSTWAPIFQV